MTTTLILISVVGFLVAVALVLIKRSVVEDPHARPVPAVSPRAGAETPDDRIQQALRAGSKIQAIKIYRKAYGSSLSQAKRAVEEKMGELGFDRHGRQGSAARTQSSSRSALPSNPEAAIDEALRQGKKIEAIKIYRLLHGTSLKESKEAVEARMSTFGPLD